MPANRDPPPAQSTGRYEPTGAGCLLGVISLLVVMIAEVIVVEILVAQEEHVVAALAFMHRHALHGRRGGWFGGIVLALNALAIAAGGACFMFGSLVLRACGISVWKLAGDDAQEAE